MVYCKLFEIFLCSEEEMKKEGASKKIKIAAMILNLTVIAALMFMEAVFYNIVSYDNYLLLEYLPIKYIVFGEILLVVFSIVPFVVKRGFRSRIFSIILSIILIIAMTGAGVLGIIKNAQIKNMFVKADETIDKIVNNSMLATDEYGVYVLKENKAKKLKHALNYKFGFNSQYSAEDTGKVIAAIETKLTKIIDSQEINDPVLLGQKLVSGEVDAVILNQSLIDTIESAGDDTDDGKQNGEYAGFSDKIRCLYTITVENALAAMNDKGNATKRCFNVYISGIDTEGDVTVKSRSDVNIIMSVNPLTGKIVLISTPRDYFVPLSISNGVRDKLTHAGNYGIDVSMSTLEMLYGIEFDYYVRLNFTGFVNIIDALGGIDVVSDYSFTADGGYSYSEGLNENLSGIEALWFARERHSFAEGDKQRGRDQMKVIEAVIEKCQSEALLNNYEEIFNNVSECLQTNMAKESIKSLVRFQLNRAPEWKIITYGVSGQGTSDYTYSVPNQRAYVMVPDDSTVEQAKKLLEDNKNNKDVKEPESLKE